MLYVLYDDRLDECDAWPGDIVKKVDDAFSIGRIKVVRSTMYVMTSEGKLVLLPREAG